MAIERRQPRPQGLLSYSSLSKYDNRPWGLGWNAGTAHVVKLPFGKEDVNRLELQEVIITTGIHFREIHVKKFIVDIFLAKTLEVLIKIAPTSYIEHLTRVLRLSVFCRHLKL